jgi:hypothetical protein
VAKLRTTRRFWPDGRQPAPYAWGGIPSTPRNTLADYDPGLVKRSTPSARYSPTPSHAPTPNPPRRTTLSKTSKSPTEPTFVSSSKAPPRPRGQNTEGHPHRRRPNAQRLLRHRNHSGHLRRLCSGYLPQSHLQLRNTPPKGTSHVLINSTSSDEQLRPYLRTSLRLRSACSRQIRNANALKRCRLLGRRK